MESINLIHPIPFNTNGGIQRICRLPSSAEPTRGPKTKVSSAIAYSSDSSKVSSVEYSYVPITTYLSSRISLACVQQSKAKRNEYRNSCENEYLTPSYRLFYFVFRIAPTVEATDHQREAFYFQDRRL